MSGDELVIVSGLDQSLISENSGVLDWVDGLIEQSLLDHSPEPALKGLKRLIKISKTTGLGLAKGLYLLQKHWDEFDIDEPFDDIAFIELGVHKHTVDRYVDVWAMYAQAAVPQELEEQIQQQNIKAQIPIAKAIAQGYEIEEKDWVRLANAVDYSEVATIVRDIKGKEPRKGSIQIFINSDGNIQVLSDGSWYFIGFLNVSDTNEPVMKAIERIISNGGILRR